MELTAKTLASARSFNERAADGVGWRGAIPSTATAWFKGLEAPPESAEFAEAVLAVQQVLFRQRDDWDGKLGRGTWRALLHRYDYVPKSSPYVVYNGRRLQLPYDRGYRTLVFDEPGSYDLHREGDWQRGRKKNAPASVIGLHWAGKILSARRLYNVFANAVFDGDNVVSDPRNVSSHGCIWIADDGVVEVVQWIDLHHRTWHGALNAISFGFDILWDPRRRYHEIGRRAGYELDWIPNPSTPRRGYDEICTLPARLARGVRAFCEDLLEVRGLGAPLIPLGANGLEPSGRPFDGVLDLDAAYGGALLANVIGHHHTNAKKSDIACWMPQLFPEYYSQEPCHG